MDFISDKSRRSLKGVLTSKLKRFLEICIIKYLEFGQNSFNRCSPHLNELIANARISSLSYQLAAYKCLLPSSVINESINEMNESTCRFTMFNTKWLFSKHSHNIRCFMTQVHSNNILKCNHLEVRFNYLLI